MYLKPQIDFLKCYKKEAAHSILSKCYRMFPVLITDSRFGDIKFKNPFTLLYHARCTDIHLYNAASRASKRYLGAGNSEISVFPRVQNELKLLLVLTVWQEVLFPKPECAIRQMGPDKLSLGAVTAERRSVSHSSSSSNLVTTQTTESFRRQRWNTSVPAVPKKKSLSSCVIIC